MGPRWLIYPILSCNKADDDGGLLAGGKEVEHGSVDTSLRGGYNKIVTELCTRDIGCV